MAERTDRVIVTFKKGTTAAAEGVGRGGAWA